MRWAEGSCAARPAIVSRTASGVASLGVGVAHLRRDQPAGDIQHRRLDVRSADVDGKREGRPGSGGGAGRLMIGGLGGSVGHQVQASMLSAGPARTGRQTVGFAQAAPCAGVNLGPVVSRHRGIGKPYVARCLLHPY